MERILKAAFLVLATAGLVPARRAEGKIGEMLSRLLSTEPPSIVDGLGAIEFLMPGQPPQRSSSFRTIQIHSIWQQQSSSIFLNLQQSVLRSSIFLDDVSRFCFPARVNPVDTGAGGMAETAMENLSEVVFISTESERPTGPVFL